MTDLLAFFLGILEHSAHPGWQDDLKLGAASVLIGGIVFGVLLYGMRVR